MAKCLSQDMRERVCRLWNRGMSVRKIADTLKMSRVTVDKVLDDELRKVDEYVCYECSKYHGHSVSTIYKPCVACSARKARDLIH